jgi:hypothetical protein
MIGKAGLAAVALLSVAAAGRGVDLRQLYDEMYPVNTLKRDALHLCQQSDLTFVRALEDDRETCYDRMPHSFALAIGRIQPGSPLSSLFADGGGLPAATFLPEAGLYSWAIPLRLPGTDLGHLAGGPAPCAGRPASRPDDRLRTVETLDALVGRPGKSVEATLAEMGLIPRDPGAGRRKPVESRGPVPVAGSALPFSPELAGPTAQRPETIGPLDTQSAGDPGDDPHAVVATGCREHT